MMVKFCELSLKNPSGFRAAAWDFTNLGKCGGFREQDFAMALRTKIRYYVQPNGDKANGDKDVYDERSFLPGKALPDELTRFEEHDSGQHSGTYCRLQWWR